ncbi:MAG TPA: glycosyltransferase family 4 protein [Planctomycetota bacterium]|nr:glycosyltransferase family 4 protein [Planctomycetota bacterium]
MADKALTIIHLVSLKGMGGRAATALRQVRLLKQRGHNVIMGCLPGTAVEERCREMGVIVDSGFHFSRGFKPTQFREDLRRLAALCDQHNADIVHAHLSQESWVAGLGAKLSAVKPAVVRSRGVVVPVKPHAFNRMLHNELTDAVIAPSRVIYEHLRALPDFDAEKVVLLPDGVDTQRFHPERRSDAVRAEFGVSPQTPWVVMVARLEKVKGHEIFFRALEQMMKDDHLIRAADRSGQMPSVGATPLPPFKALCACDERTPGAFDAAVKLAREIGVGEGVLAFTGMRSDIESIVASADVIALPSLGSEGSTRVGLEAGACAVPVVASDAGCLPEVVRTRRTGLIVPKGDERALAGAMAAMISNLERAREMGRAAREHILEHYDERVMVERLEEVYRKATGRE